MSFISPIQAASVTARDLLRESELIKRNIQVGLQTVEKGEAARKSTMNAVTQIQQNNEETMLKIKQAMLNAAEAGTLRGSIQIGSIIDVTA